LIWGIFNREIEVPMPARMDVQNMYAFVDRVIDEQQDAKCSKVVLDFASLIFIEPVGVVVLSNLIEYFKRAGVKVFFKNHTRDTDCIRYLDDSEFFSRYLKHPLFEGASPRRTTVPLMLIERDRTTEYLYLKLMPWISDAVNIERSSLESLRASIEEIFHNVNDHSGVGIGCAFAQHFPNKSQIQIAISDFGAGIPKKVRTVLPGMSDPAAIRKACEEGFTTKSNVQNRGAGLPTLIKFVTTKTGGNVVIASGRGEVVCSMNAGRTKLTARQSPGYYPGTLVRVILRTDSLRRAVADVEPEEFEW
jgi:hypothetical protein